MFTKNIREGYRSLSLGYRVWKWLYSKTHLPIVPIYGFFPVKMKTFIGKPIPYDPEHTPESLSKQVGTSFLLTLPSTHVSCNYCCFITSGCACNRANDQGAPEKTWQHFTCSRGTRLQPIGPENCMTQNEDLSTHCFPTALFARRRSN